MKFSVRQILASAAGAVLAAVIASLFGVKGTIIGVAIGSGAATFGTAFVSQSIEHGHKVVKQVVVRVPESATLLRRFGGTAASGQTESPSPEESALTEETASTATEADDTMELAATTSVTDATVEMRALDSTPEPDTEELPVSNPARRSIPWRAIAGTAAVVFVLALATVTVIELLAGEPLANLLGGHGKSNTPSVGQIFNPPAPRTTTTTVPPTTTTSSSSTTTSTSTTTTTTAGGSTTTSSTAPSSTTTSTTSPTGSTTTTTG